ncbi:hypothetical protein [Sandaracinus amylolyticus]|uniref:hypothetical protein n=1 Tax=Sandaracinus amylolyticus TaxID=927083 RepID=UPI001F41593A|nr:hypothetical protein [Sandaracinus amylolyticus]UJR83108.1 Hypothetical protein I5071_51740 [Sandaracinus amylolyticus]
MDRRGWIVFLVVLLGIGGALVGWNAWIEAEERADAERREARRAERMREAEERVARLIEESRELMPAVIEGVALGQTIDEVRAARRAITPARDAGRGGLVMMEERLSNGGQAMYGFDRQAQRLVQVQVLSMMPTTAAIAPHLTAMRDTYGTPTGIWDCPTTGGVPTRRFTWRRSLTTVSDVFLIYGDRVSVTLYIATSEQIGRSLQMASCTTVPADRVEQFPVVSPEQLQQMQGGR